MHCAADTKHAGATRMLLQSVGGWVLMAVPVSDRAMTKSSRSLAAENTVHQATMDHSCFIVQRYCAWPRLYEVTHCKHAIHE